MNEEYSVTTSFTLLLVSVELRQGLMSNLAQIEGPVENKQVK